MFPYIMFVYIYYLEARREARKAFMALSSVDKTADGGGSEPYKNSSDALMEDLATDDVQSTGGTTPVSLYLAV